MSRATTQGDHIRAAQERARQERQSRTDREKTMTLDDREEIPPRPAVTSQDVQGFRDRVGSGDDAALAAEIEDFIAPIMDYLNAGFTGTGGLKEWAVDDAHYRAALIGYVKHLRMTIRIIEYEGPRDQ